MTSTWGKPIFTSRPPLPAVVQVVGPRDAMAQTIAQYLRCATFCIHGVDGGVDKPFGLNAVEHEWPDPSVKLNYPVASLIERTDTFVEAFFQPRPMEETLGVYDCLIGQQPDPVWPKTVLWKTGEATAEFQIDFWCSSKPERAAVDAQLGYLFNPGQERTGVLLGGHPRYYSRAVRATHLSTRRIDVEDAVYANERRLMVIVTANVDIVDLRLAVLLSPAVAVEATDPNDPGASS